METKPFTRFTVEQSDKKVTWEVPNDDVNIYDCIEAFETLLSGMTFTPTTVLIGLKNHIEETKHLYSIDDDGKD